MIRLKPLVRTLAESDSISDDIKNELNDNQVLRVESLKNSTGDLQTIVIHLSNGKSIKIGGFSDEDVISAEISI